MYYVDKNLLGSKEHVRPASWHKIKNKMNNDCLCFDGTSAPGTVTSFARIMKRKISVIPESIKKSMQECFIPINLSGLSHVLHDGQLNQMLEDLSDIVTNDLSPISDYLPFYARNISLLNSCVPIKISSISDFVEVDSEGFCQQVIYDTAATKTGRMSVVSGPNVLTLKKGFKNNIVSRFEDGHIVEVDYSALEPRTALAVTNSDFAHKEDVYTAVGCLLGIPDRNITKQVVISFLYGAGHDTICRVAGIDKHILIPKLNELKDLFFYDQTVDSLKKQLIQHGWFKNHAGRVVFPTSDKPGTLFNNYCQSTAVDVALSGFSALFNFFSSRNLGTVPLCFIHDAVLLDVPSDELEIVRNNTKKLPTYLGIGFPTKMKVLN